jgi:dienelactone hydrolase
VILHDGEKSDGRASLYTDQLLGAGFAVLEIAYLPGDSLEAVLTALVTHPRVWGQQLGLLGFGAGARLVAQWSGPIGARALLYPGCAGLAPPAMRGGAVLLMHGAADSVNEPGACADLGKALAASGMAVRLRTFDRASYAWDRPAFSGEGRSLLPRPDGPGRVIAEAWPELAALSAAEVAGFFATSLLGHRP